MANTESFNIMCFTWNAAGLRLCKTMSQVRADEDRGRLLNRVRAQSSCVAPDFFEEIRKVIRAENPNLVAITTQDEDKSGTYFHASFLESQMGELNYQLLKRDKIEGVGEKASKFTKDAVINGEPSGSALRMSIYAHNDTMDKLQVEEKKLAKIFPDNHGQQELTCTQGGTTSGAVVSYVWHPNYGKFAFIAVHLPSGQNALKLGQKMSYSKYRSTIQAYNTICLNNLTHEFVDKITNPDAKPDHIILMGDMNYDIILPEGTSSDTVTKWVQNFNQQSVSKLQSWDEMEAAKQGPLKGFHEGVSDHGPLFLPTWKMARGRGKECSVGSDARSIPVGCFDNPDPDLGGFGWHDRILYQGIQGKTQHMLHCMSYNRMDVLNMHQSTHAGVTALFELRQIR